MDAILTLENATTFAGSSFVASGEAYGEAIFNTSMTGYQEILTDPSCRGQLVVMTCPLIGNFGVNSADVESRRPWAQGFVVRECSRSFRNRRGQKELREHLRDNGILVIEGVDTKPLPRRLRIRGAMDSFNFAPWRRGFSHVFVISFL